MQQRPGHRVVGSMRTQRTQPALPGVTLPTIPIVEQTSQTTMAPQAARRTRRSGGKIVVLWGLAFLLEGLYLALYPLLASGAQAHDPFRQALESIFPWASTFYWSTRWPIFAQAFSYVPWLNPQSGGAINLSFLLLGIACAIALLAARIASRGVRQQFSHAGERGIFWTMLLATVLFGLALVCAPIEKDVLTQDMGLYGLYGRMVVIYHINPYVVPPTAFPGDILQALVVSPKTLGTAPYGPIWLDISILVAFLAQHSVAHVLLGFRLIGLIAHVVNAVLIWVLLTRLKPELRAPATLLYAWNPVVLLLGIGMMHQEEVVVMLALLAFLFSQHNLRTLAWVFMLLAALTHPFFLLLLPLFLRVMLKEARLVHFGRRFLWCLGIGCVSVLVVGLTYSPYWQGLGQAGLLAYLQQAFLPDTAVSSLDAALQSVPASPPSVIHGLISPAHWAMLVLALVGCLLLFAIWFADTLELALLFSTWLLLLLVVLMPIYWPSYVVFPLALTICSTSRSTTKLTVLLAFGALLSSFLMLEHAPWSGQALLTVGLPFLLWSWVLFFTSTWRMTRPVESEEPEKQVRRAPSFSRPPWLSRSGRIQRNR